MRATLIADGERPLATVHRLRPRIVVACTPTRQPTERSGRGEATLIDLSRARSRRRPLPNFDSPPEGTAA
jgi:hypothetical protein